MRGPARSALPHFYAPLAPLPHAPPTAREAGLRPKGHSTGRDRTCAHAWYLTAREGGVRVRPR
eukprot:10142288-Alexandrium_andersonii.AAC.1